MDEILKDKRFAHIPRDPAFKRVPRNERKVKIDKRFQSMFEDKKFKIKYTVDKRGKPIRNSSVENLRQYYAVESSGESEESSGDEEAKLNCEEKLSKSKDSIKSEKKKTVSKSNESAGNNCLSPVKSIVGKKSSKSKRRGDRDSESSDSSLTGSKQSELEESSGNDHDNSDFLPDDNNDVLERGNHNFDAKIRARLQDLSVDYARGEGIILSDSSSDEESSDEDEDENDVEHSWGQLDQDVEKTDESTHRLALCNMDWDRLRASDLMVVLNSFLPKGGVLHSVTIYPSDYGLERLKEEEKQGPLELRKQVEDGDDEEDDEKRKKAWDDDDDDNDEGEEGSQYEREKLRQYQLNRLRYYYAVIVCDSVKTADALYKDCDGMEYESSASRMDLRFIPDGTTFDQEPRESCTELPNMTKFEPQLFITTALQQSNVRLTWDETDPQRVRLNQKINSGNMDEVDDDDLKVYVAASSSEEEVSSSGEDEEKGKGEHMSKYRMLLQSIEAQEEEKRQKNMEMEVTWGINLKEKVEKRLKEGKPDEMTPFQKYMQKRKENTIAKREERMKKKQQKESAEGSEDSANDDEEEEEDDDDDDDDDDDNDVPSGIDMNDAYFKEEFANEEFAPAEKTKSKNKKNKKNKGDKSVDEETKRKKAELELLLMDEDDNKNHFNLKDILVEDTKSKMKRKKKKMKFKEIDAEKKEDDFEINVQDNRFSALFTSHLYNIDPADPHYKKTKGMETLRQEKVNRRDVVEVPTKRQKVETPGKKKDAELSLLVKNVKRKTQTLKK